MRKCPLLPTGSRVVLEAAFPDLKPRGVILLRDFAQPHGVVRAVGPDCEYLQPGQHVIYKKFVEVMVTVEQDPYSLVKEDDVLCVIG